MTVIPLLRHVESLVFGGAGVLAGVLGGGVVATSFSQIDPNLAGSVAKVIPPAAGAATLLRTQ